MKSSRSNRVGKKELEIFDNFNVDDNLPKHQKENQAELTLNGDQPNGVTFSVPTEGGGWSMEDDDISYKKKTNWFIRRIIKNYLKKVKRKNTIITIREYFLNFAENFNELTPVADIADHYEKAIIQSTELGQESLTEKLKDLLDVVRGETHLIQMGLKNYVTQEQVLDFFEKTDEDKNIKLTWIQNFVKVIPNKIVKLKKEIDSRNVFDNYVILHYDPLGSATSLTKEEEELKKDPILFGVIKNSTRLYYVGDWKDDYCDLTLEGMFETLGEKTLEINNKNLKTYINKVGEYEQRRKKQSK
jgi:hypothetical protein